MTTHFVCDHLPASKLLALQSRQRDPSLKYVTAAWVTDSVAAGRRLDEVDYRLPGLKNLHGGSLKELFGRQVTPLSAQTSSIGVASISTDDSPIHLRQPYIPGKSIRSSRSLFVEEVTSPTRASDLRSTEGNPNFIQDYFGQSRLHFIGSWRSRLPKLVAKIMEENSGFKESTIIPKSRSSSVSSSGARVVVHVDMDCFFVSVLIRSKPELASKPVAVAHSNKAGSSEISSCNYPARNFGLSSGMFMSRALALCPDLIVLKYDFEAYETVSEQIYRIFFSSAPVVQVNYD